jgi:RNA polymerase sigma factor (sigma-70 family)
LDQMDSPPMIEPAAQPPTPPTEADLVRCAAGLQLILMRLSRDVHLSRDLAQEVMIATLLAIRAGRVESAEKLPGYVRATARHYYFSHVRNLPVQRQADAEVLAWRLSNPSPLESMEADELQQMAHQVLNDLASDRDRDLILSFYVHGRPKAELMRRFGLTAGNFDKLLSRARARMKGLMDAKWQEKLNGRKPIVSEMSPEIVFRIREST